MTVEEAFQLLRALKAPPAAIARQQLVVETANELCAGVLGRFPSVSIGIDQVLCGAALHDVGTLPFPGQPEMTGEDQLRHMGVAPEIAACCNARRTLSEASSLEVVLVALADAIWKGQRDKLVESALADKLCAAVDLQAEEVWLAVDALLAGIAKHGPRRLAQVAGMA